MKTTTGVVLIAAVALAAILSACATSGVQRQDVATASLDQLRSELLAGEDQVEVTNEALNSLRSSDNLTAASRDFSRELARLERRASTVRARRAAMEARLGDHIARWQEDLGGVSSEEARRAAGERASTLESAANNVESALNTVKEAYEPYMSHLEDIELILANDLSRNGVASISGTIDETLELSRALRAAIDEAINAITLARTEFRR